MSWTPLASRHRRRPGLSPFADDDAPRPRWRFAAELPVLLVVAMVVALLLKAFVAQAFFIPSGSMEPQLEVGDRVVVSRISYQLHDPRRGDIVVFPSVTEVNDDESGLNPGRLFGDLLEGLGVRAPDETELIKRIIGLPGETVEARGGRVLVDGRELVEPYLPDDLATEDFGPVTVPAGFVFVMGDNRNPGMSQDSRAFGPVPVDSIVGRAVARVWPPDRAANL